MSIIYNGHYVKFESGLLVCFYTSKYSVSMNNVFIWSFPYLFKDTNISVFAFSGSNLIAYSNDNLTSSKVELSGHYSNNSLSILAIGYWK